MKTTSSAAKPTNVTPLNSPSYWNTRAKEARAKGDLREAFHYRKMGEKHAHALRLKAAGFDDLTSGEILALFAEYVSNAHPNTRAVMRRKVDQLRAVDEVECSMFPALIIGRRP